MPELLKVGLFRPDALRRSTVSEVPLLREVGSPVSSCTYPYGDKLVSVTDIFASVLLILVINTSRSNTVNLNPPTRT